MRYQFWRRVYAIQRRLAILPYDVAVLVQFIHNATRYGIRPTLAVLRSVV